MSKLDDIERNYAIVAPLIPPSEVRWLIARVKKLQTALNDIKVGVDQQRSIDRKLPYDEALNLIEIVANSVLKEKK